MTSKSETLFTEEFSPREGGNQLSTIEVRFMDTEIGNTRFIAVDLAVSSALFGDLAVAEQYGLAILEAVRIAREKRLELGLDDAGKPFLTSKVRNPNSPLSEVQMRVLSALMDDDRGKVILQREHRRTGGANQQPERAWIYRLKDGEQIRRVHIGTLSSLKKGKFLKRVDPKLPVEQQGYTSYYDISDLGVEMVYQYWQEPSSNQ